MQEQLVVSWSGQAFAFLRAKSRADGTFQILELGVERQGGTDSPDLFIQRLQSLGLKGGKASVMLRPEQYQFLQIDTPQVPPDELRAAARFQIRDMVEGHLDDITLDVMRVGDDEHKGGNSNLFVVAASSTVVREMLELAESMDWDVSVIDVQETSQRNLQSALSRIDGALQRADAALVLAEERMALLTISANEELFYTRRIELPHGFMKLPWGQGAEAAPADSYMPVSEYVPDYHDAHATDYGITAGGAATAADGDDERVQRFLVEVQRSLDLWDRSWSSLPLAGLRVFAGERSQEMAQWLGRETGQAVTVMELDSVFAGATAEAPDTLEDADVAALNRAYCIPLLGMLLRTESKKL